ncbi:putative reverse transcriptase domain-containing protein [Tanacetum coccineum]
MPIELGSLGVIIGMDWLAKYRAVIVCAEKTVRIPWRIEMVIVHGDESDRGNETRLNIISCTKMQKYMLKGCSIFLAHVTIKEIEDKSSRALKPRRSDLRTYRSFDIFPEVFHEDLPGLPPTRQVELQIDLIPGATPVIPSFEYGKKIFQRWHLELDMNKKEHKENLKTILKLLKKEELYAKFYKCKFWLPKASPKTPTEISQFLALTGYYQRFIEGFLKIAMSMTKLTQKGVKFDWGGKAEAAFQLIKRKLCSAPILALPEGSEDFIVYCDASIKGLGTVLMQREK